MGLTNKKEEQLRQMPVIQSRIKTSKNGRFVIQQTVITHVKPIEYYRAIISNTAKVTEEPLDDDELMIEDGLDLLKKIRIK